MDKIFEMIITGLPAVAVLIYLFKGREERISTLETRVDECLESRLSDNKALLDLIKK